MIVTGSSSFSPAGCELAPVDPVICYPSYMSLDQFIDVERLRSLHGYLIERIRAHASGNSDPKFYTGPYTLEKVDAGNPGSRMIYLSESAEPDSYFDLDRTELWKRTAAAADEFAPLIEFIETLPFASIGRMLIIYEDCSRPVPPHRDHTQTEILHEFIWMRTDLGKKLYMLNIANGERSYVDGYSAWFDSVNQYHGGDPCDELAFSIRVDGRFTDDFRSGIPRPEFNLSSTPAYWACMEKKRRTQ